MNSKRMTNSRRRGFRPKGRRSAIPQKRRVNALLNGRNVRPSADPSAIVINPWNSITLVFETDADASLYADDVYTNLLEVLGITGTDIQFNFRIKEYRAWELAGGALEVAALDLINTSNNKVINTVSDEPGRNHFAKVGYIWPRAHQNSIKAPSMGTTVQDPVLIARSTAETANIILHLNILWRTIEQQLPPAPAFKSKKTFQHQKALRKMFQDLNVNDDGDLVKLNGPGDGSTGYESGTDCYDNSDNDEEN